MPSPLLIVCGLLLGVLLFGKDLPKVAKQIGQSMIEFRKGLNEMNETKKAGSSSGSRTDTSERETDGESEEDDDREVIGTKFAPHNISS